MNPDLQALYFNITQNGQSILQLAKQTNTRWTITIILAVAIVTFCVIVFIRQKKIIRKLDQLTKKTEETSARGEP